MKTMFRTMALGSALAATAMTALVPTPAAAQGWNGGGYHRGGGNGVGIAIAAGVLGLAVGAALADHHHAGPPPVPVTYAPPADCYDGYDGTCYPVDDYYRAGWSWRNGSWWDRDGQRFSQPFMGRGGYGGYDAGPRGGYDGGDRGRGGFDGGRGGPGGWGGGDRGPGGRR